MRPGDGISVKSAALHEGSAPARFSVGDLFSPERTWKDQNRLTLLFLGLILAGLLAADLMSDPVIHVHFFYVILVGLIAWLLSPLPAYLIGILLPLLRLAAFGYRATAGSMSEAFINSAIEIAVLTLVVFLIVRIKALVVEVRISREKIPICDRCRSVRNTNGQWEMIESYISRQANIKFTHGICPSCRQSEEMTDESLDKFLRRKQFI